MNIIAPLPPNLNPEPESSAKPRGRRIPLIETWDAYRAALARSMDCPGPDGEADRQAALAFAAGRLPHDVVGRYYADMRRGRRS